MIIVTAETKIFGAERKIFKISVKGHSGYADAGHDIVCAGVSSAFEYMLNLIARRFLSEESCGVNTDPKVPLAALRLDKFYSGPHSERDDYIIAGLLNGFIEHVKNIENEFGKYIRVIMKDL